MLKKLAVLFLLGGGGYLIYRTWANVDRGISDGTGGGGFMGGLIDAAYGLGDSVVGSVSGGLNDSLSTSIKGLAFIKGWEELRLMPYFATADEKAAGKLTIGYGHMYRTSDPVQVAKYENGITAKEAEALFISDVMDNEQPIRDGVKVKLSQSQFDALVAFRINTGRIGPTMLKKLNAGDYVGAGNEFMRWVYQGDKVLNGLYKRRAAETQIWFNAYYNSAH